MIINKNLSKTLSTTQQAFWVGRIKGAEMHQQPPI